MGGKQQAEGPDLGAGVALADVPQDGMLAGQVNGEAVLLARVEGELRAVGARCTHYGGPLGKGLVVGDTVRCPWHHACFSLRTGEAIGAPALNPVACWKVEIEGERAFVREKLPASLPERTPAKSPASVVIVGGGAAGEAAAETLRREGYTGPVTILSDDTALPCDRPNLSKDYLAGTAQPSWIPLRGEAFYRDHDIDLRLGTRVAKLDTASSRVVLEDGSELGYGALLLATGAEPVRLDLPGADRVHYLRTQADSEAIIAAVEAGAKWAVVIGASFIGLEVAASLRQRGVGVHVVAPDKRPLERVMGPELGDFIRTLHEKEGVEFHLEQTATEFDANGVTLQNGKRIECDLVVAGIGVRPRTALAEAAGLATDNGVVVDEYLAASAPNVYAAGDIARWPDAVSGERIRVEHWVVAQRQGQCAARNILGAGERYSDPPFFWSRHYDAAINYVGHARRWERIETDGNPADYDFAARFMDGEKALALATIYRDIESLEFEAELERL